MAAFQNSRAKRNHCAGSEIILGTIQSEESIMRTLGSSVAGWLLPLFLLLLGSSGYGADRALRLAYLQNDLHQLACFVALEKGYFSQEGVTVEVGGIFKAGPEEMSGFAAGELDVGYVGEAPATVAVANGTADVRIVAQANLEGSAIVRRKGSGLNDLNDLKGKTVAVPGYATVQDFLIRRALEKAGTPLQSVQIITLKPPEMIPAIRARQIDAFVAWEPYPAKAVALGVGEILLYSKDLWPKHPCCVVVVDTRLLSTRPDAVQGLLKAHVRATNYINGHSDDAASIGARFTGMDLATVKLAMKNICYQYELDVQGELEYVSFLKRLRAIKVADPERFVHTILVRGPLNRALEKSSAQSE